MPQKEYAMEGYLKIVSFHDENVGFDGGDLEEAVKKATQKAERYLEELEEDGDIKGVKVLSMSTQSIDRGNFAAYTITMALEVVWRIEEEAGA